jgi:phosphoglycerate dehydrogenase-like enzyme
MSSISLLAISNPALPELSRLEELQGPVDLIVSNDLEYLTARVADADVILNCAFRGDLFCTVFPLARRVRWVHSLAAGVETILCPELAASPVPLTNGRGVFRGSLAEFTITAILYFAKEVRRMIRQQQAGLWEQFDVVQTKGQTLGIVGYGEIGRASAELAKALGMKVIALRRRASLSQADPLLDAVYPPDKLRDLMAAADYVLAAAPITPETRGMIGAAELQAMKPTGVIINVGRGPVIDETALIDALREGRIAGAALDVFDEEPLAPGHPFYELENVLLSPHCADHTPGWVGLAMQQFLEEFERFRTGQPLRNVVDKQAGY